MPEVTGFGTFAALLEEQLSENISRRILSGKQAMIVWWSIGAGVHVEPHSHPNEQIAWILKGKMEFRLGSEQRVCSAGDVVERFCHVIGHDKKRPAIPRPPHELEDACVTRADPVRYLAGLSSD